MSITAATAQGDPNNGGGIFTNRPGGIVLDSSGLNVKNVTRAGNTLTLAVDSYTGHTYQLQRSAAPGTGFTSVGAAQMGTTGSTLAFSSDDGAAPRDFYRVLVDP